MSPSPLQGLSAEFRDTHKLSDFGLCKKNSKKCEIFKTSMYQVVKAKLRPLVLLSSYNAGVGVSGVDPEPSVQLMQGRMVHRVSTIACPLTGLPADEDLKGGGESEEPVSAASAASPSSKFSVTFGAATLLPSSKRCGGTNGS